MSAPLALFVRLKLIFIYAEFNSLQVRESHAEDVELPQSLGDSFTR